MYDPDDIREDWDRLRFRIYDFDDGDSPWFPAKAEVCGNCRGKGKTVNPAIDGNGLGAEDFAEDPDFKQDYMSGVYDEPCCVCGGRGMTLVPASDEGQKAWDDYHRAMAEMQAQYNAERRLGC
jgi:hypothetical protein